MEKILYVIGDSHSRSFSNNPNFLPLFIGQGKENCFVSDFTLEHTKSNLLKVLSKIKGNSHVLLVLGEPDTRYYLGKGWTPWTQEGEDKLEGYQDKIDNSVQRYSRLLEFLRINFDHTFWVFNVIASPRKNQNILVDYFNEQLKRYSSEKELGFVETNHLIYEPDHSTILHEYSGDVVHLNNKIQPLVEIFFIESNILHSSKFEQNEAWDNKSIHSMFEYNERFGCYIMENKNSNPMEMESIIFSKNNIANLDGELLTTLKKTGVVIIPDYLSPEILEQLNNEFEKALSLNNDFAKPMEYSEGRAAKVFRNKIEEEVLPKTYEVFSQEWMQKLANEYVGESVGLNTEIFVVNDVVGSKHHANDLHFDVVSTFKYFIYLTDTTSENGAFACAPSTHLRSAEIRKKLGDNINYDNRYLTRDLPVKPEEVIPIEGKAGTLIIFDTDVFHKAGTVSKGERRVMRGHCRPVKLPIPIKKESWLQKIKRKLISKQ